MYSRQEKGRVMWYIKMIHFNPLKYLSVEILCICIYYQRKNILKESIKIIGNVFENYAQCQKMLHLEKKGILEVYVVSFLKFV